MYNLVTYLIIPALIVLAAWVLYARLFANKKIGTLTQLTAIVVLTVLGFFVGGYYNTNIAPPKSVPSCSLCGLDIIIILPLYFLAAVVATTVFRIRYRVSKQSGTKNKTG